MAKKSFFQSGSTGLNLEEEIYYKFEDHTLESL